MTSRAALYLRISKDDARTGLAVERQRAECLRVIEREGLALVETYTDNGVSAYKRDVKRPAYDRMSKDYDLGKFDVVVCWDIDRLSRQPSQLERWIELGESRGLAILTPSEQTDLGTDNGRMFLRIKAAVARAEIERKSAREKAQVAQAKANGTYKCRVGFNDAEVIVRIFREVLAGTKVYRVGAGLNAEGLRTRAGKEWSGSAVRRIIMTPRHRGVLISETDYDSAVVLVTQGEKVGAKNKGLYSGVARCSTCGASMTASGDRYKCAYATNHPGSRGHVTIPRVQLEERIDKAMVAAFTFGRESMEPKTADVTALDVELARVAEERQRVISLVRRDLISEKEAEGELRDLRSKAEGLEQRRRTTIADNAHAQMLDGILGGLWTPGRVAIDDVVALKQEVATRWTDLDTDKRRELAKEFLTIKVLAFGPSDRLDVQHDVVASLNADG